MADKQKALINPVLYEDLNKPFASMAEASKAIEGFWDEVYDLRAKYKLPDVYIIFRAQYRTGEGDPVDFYTSAAAGYELYQEGMTAWAFGNVQAERQERISSLMAKSIKKLRDK